MSEEKVKHTPLPWKWGDKQSTISAYRQECLDDKSVDSADMSDVLTAESRHVIIPWDYEGYSCGLYMRPEDAEFIVRACNNFYKLLEACNAAIEYDKAIKDCANNPDKRATCLTAQGANLDILYDKWMKLAKQAITEATDE